VTELTPPTESFLRRGFDSTAQWVDHRIGWHRLPKVFGLVVLIGLRDILRRENLHDTEDEAGSPPPYDEKVRTERTPDGSYNDLDNPTMGMAGRRFGRNVPLDKAVPETDRLLRPNPREVSRELLTREAFIPATSVNVLAATWIQFMVKDWFSHGQGDPKRGFDLPLDDGDPWPAEGRPMLIPATVADPTDTEGHGNTFINQNSPWWDGSSIYGDSLEQQHLIRQGSGGRIKVTSTGLVVLPDDPTVDPTLVPGFWTGLAMMGSLFCLEHNAVCDALAKANPTWDDERLFQHARLVVAALVAKIHTVQWTPAIIAHPTTVTALRANWYGIAGKWISDHFGRISGSEVISGIVGGETDHFGVPYSLTEEFSIVYRMHPLIPDDYPVRRWTDDSELASYGLRDLTGPAGRTVLEATDPADLLYSFGTANPGAIVLHNFPRFLQEFIRPDGKYTDLAATDILRTRELGVPRYNEFRRLLHLEPALSFADLTDDAGDQAMLARLYADVEEVDTIVGMFAEKRPKGFAFSDTAFRIFILMASRRLNSDRFFTGAYTEDAYGEVGLRWVRDNDMGSVVLRHYPQLGDSLRGVDNPFAPWRRVEVS